MDEQIAAFDVGQLVKEDVFGVLARHVPELFSRHQQYGTKYAEHRRASHLVGQNHLRQSAEIELVSNLFELGVKTLRKCEPIAAF